MKPTLTARELRERAEWKAGEEPEVGPGQAEVWTREQIQQSLLELRIHQIELELQNEELQETRTELAQALLRYQDLFQRSPVAYLLLDETGLVVQANQTAIDLLGGEDLKGTSLAICLHEGAYDELHRTLRRALRHELPATCEVRLRGPEARFVQVDALPSSSEFSGEYQVRVTLTDITEFRRIQKGMARVQRLESLGTLAGGMAHDYNSHLGIILFACGLLRSEFSPGDPGSELVREVEKAAEASAALNAKVLAFGRRQVMVPEVLDVGLAIEESLKGIGRIFEDSIEVRVQGAEEPTFVSMDPLQLHQIVLNLGGNACDAMPEGGVLEISVREVEVEHDRAESITGGRYALVSFQDDGPGIPEEIRGRIFEPFFTTKLLGRGTGLGLATVNGIVGQSGGHLEVHSAPGEGTRFEIYLPVVPPPELPNAADGSKVQPEATEASKTRRQGKATVLLVEDEGSLRVLGQRLLERHGLAVLACGSAEEALELFERRGEEIDLVYSDVVLPGMDGCELARRIRGLRPGIPIALTSGHPKDLLDLRELQAEGVGFLRKPFYSPELYRVIDELLAGRRGPEPSSES